MKIDKHWVLWTAFFVVELVLLRSTVKTAPQTLEPPEAWRQDALLSAIASTGAVLLGLVTWRMRWSMRPRLLRVIMLVLMGVGLAVSVLEWKRVYDTSWIIAKSAAMPGPEKNDKLTKTDQSKGDSE